MASSLFSTMTTPFPAAKPSALITNGKSKWSTSLQAFSKSVTSTYFAVGIWCLIIKSLEKIIESCVLKQKATFYLLQIYR